MGAGYTLIRSARKTLAVEVSRTGEVVVRAPTRCPQETIRRFVERHGDWIKRKIALQRKRAAAHPEPDGDARAALFTRAQVVLPARTAYFAARMGLSPAGVRITDAKTRFGSCSPQNRICYSWRLMLYPDGAVDYVVVHELAHIVHKNHGKAFYALIESVLPDYRARRALLKE